MGLTVKSQSRDLPVPIDKLPDAEKWFEYAREQARRALTDIKEQACECQRLAFAQNAPNPAINGLAALDLFVEPSF